MHEFSIYLLETKIVLGERNGRTLKILAQGTQKAIPDRKYLYPCYVANQTLSIC